MEPTLPTTGAPGDVQKPSLSNRLELVAAALTGVVGLEFLALIIGVSSGGPYRSVADRIEVVSLNLDAKMALILLVAAMLATLRDVATADFQPPRSDLGQRTLMAVAALGVIIAVLSLIGIGLDLSRSEVTSFGTNAGAAVIHRLAIVLMAAVPAGWSLSALGIRITRNS